MITPVSFKFTEGIRASRSNVNTPNFWSSPVRTSHKAELMIQGSLSVMRTAQEKGRSGLTANPVHREENPWCRERKRQVKYYNVTSRRVLLNIVAVGSSKYYIL
jgi:hypothetical protein